MGKNRNRNRIMFFAILLAGICFLCACAGGAEDRLPAPRPEVTQVEQQGIQNLPAPSFVPYGYSFLSDEGKAVYDRLLELEAAVDTDVAVSIPAALSQDDVQTLLDAFFDDNPQAYWAQPVLHTEEGMPRRLFLTFALGFDRVRVLHQREEIDEQVRILLDSVDGEAGDIVTLIHDRIAAHITYHPGAPASTIGTLYGGLVERAGVCDDFSKTFLYLMREKEIPCIYIRGTGHRGRLHSWNAVMLDGEWYFVDVTWNAKRPVRRNYLCISSEEADRERVWDNSQYPFLPYSGARKYDYFIRGGYCVYPQSSQDILDDLAKAFAKQFAGRLQRGDPEFLEVKVIGDSLEYEHVRDLFFADPFFVLDRINEILASEYGGLSIRRENTVTCNSNDAMRIILITLQ